MQYMYGCPGLKDIVLVPAVLDLDGAPGARLIANIVDVDPAIGMRVRVSFAPVADGWKPPQFRSADS